MTEYISKEEAIESHGCHSQSRTERKGEPMMLMLTLDDAVKVTKQLVINEVDDDENIRQELEQKCWFPPTTDTAAEHLNDLIFDINPAEICTHIQKDNLKEWCAFMQTEMKMAMVQLPSWAERRTDERYNQQAGGDLRASEDDAALRMGIEALKAHTQPVRHGHWIHDGLDIPHGVDWMHCSECGKRDKYCPTTMTNYCPNCGAKMDGEEDG